MAAPLRVVFMGTPEFALPSLRALHAASDITKVVAVYTQPDRPAGRGKKMAEPPVKTLAKELGLPVFQPESINETEERRRLADMMADVYVVVAYAQFLSGGILNLPRIFCVNVHSSLLPKYRGAAPIQYAVLNGEKETGVTTMKLVSKMDAGPVLMQKKMELPPHMTAKQLHDKLAAMGGELLAETMQSLWSGNFTETKQDEALVTFAPSLKKQDGMINWNEEGARIIRKILAFDPWPGTFTRSSKGSVKILKAQLHGDLKGLSEHLEPGEIHTDSGAFYVRCKDGWIEILQLQPEGKPPVSARDFMNGLRNTPHYSFKTEVVNEK